METIKIKIHSVVDVITNSSTVIYTYQNSAEQTKELVAEMLILSGITDKNPDDVFYYGVFCDNDNYLEDNEDLPEDCPEWKSGSTDQDEWIEKQKLSIIMGNIEKPEWMSSRETDRYGDGWDPDSYLYLIPKEEKYKVFGEKIKSLLGSVSADGGRNG